MACVRLKRFSPVDIFEALPPQCFAYGSGVMILITCVTSLAISYADNHVTRFTSISEAGARPPESSVFGFLLSIYCFLVVLTIWNVYKLGNPPTSAQGWACLIGILSTVGVEIVANFQERTILVVHSIGAGMAFFLAIVYVAFIVMISPYLRVLRSCCLALASVSLLTMAISGGIVFYRLKVTGVSDEDRSSTANLYLTSTITEYILATSINIFIVSLAKDLKLSQKPRPDKRSSRDRVVEAGLAVEE